MKTPQQLPAPSRRDFLKDVVVASAATAGGISLIPAAHAANPPTTAAPARTPTAPVPPDHFKKLSLGVKPSLLARGGVVIETKHLTFLTFPGVQVGAQGQQAGAGRAVIELKGCVSMKGCYTSQSSKLPEVDHLDLCEIFEVENSTWAKSKQVAALTALRHFVFSFVDTTFACLATGVNVELRNESFPATLAYTKLRDLGD